MGRSETHSKTPLWYHFCMPENLLAIDNGTQSVRALLFDPHGTLLAKSRVPLTYAGEVQGVGEQDPKFSGRRSARPASCSGRFRGLTAAASPLLP